MYLNKIYDSNGWSKGEQNTQKKHSIVELFLNFEFGQNFTIKINKNEHTYTK